MTASRSSSDYKVWPAQLKEMLAAINAQQSVNDWLSQRRIEAKSPRSVARLARQHWTDDHGIGWRWRFCAFVERHERTIGIDDVASEIEKSERREGKKARNYTTILRGYISSGRRPLAESRQEAVERCLRDDGGIDAEAFFNSEKIFTEKQLRAAVEALEVHQPQKRELDLDHLQDCDFNFEDEGRKLFADEVTAFLQTDKDIQSENRKRNVCVVFSEHVREMHGTLRKLLVEHHKGDFLKRPTIVIDGTTGQPQSVYEKIVADDGRPRATEISEMAHEIVRQLELKPSIVVITNFEPVLLGLGGASVKAACRNLGAYDLIARVAKSLSNNSRFILVVNHEIVVATTSYIHGAIEFPPLSGNQPNQIEVIDEMLQHADMVRLSAPTRAAIMRTRQFPSDIQLALIDYAGRHKLCSTGTLIECIRTGAIDFLASLTLSDVCERSGFSEGRRSAMSEEDRIMYLVLLVSALAEDRVELITIVRTLKRVFDESSVDTETVLRSANKLEKLIPDLFSVATISIGVDPEEKKLADLSPTFRSSLLRVIEERSYPADSSIPSADIVAKTRRCIAKIAREKFKGSIEGDKSRLAHEPRVIRYALLSVLLYLASIRSDSTETKIEDREYASRGTPKVRFQESIDRRALRLAYRILEDLENTHGEDGYALSRSKVGLQLKLQLWLLFQHTGRSHPRIGLRYREYLGPAASSPVRLRRLHAGENLNMFASLAVASFGLNLDSYGQLVITAAERYVTHLKRIKHPSFGNRDTRLKRVKLQKIQIDLLMRSGSLRDAEHYCRDCLAESGFYRDQHFGRLCDEQGRILLHLIPPIEDLVSVASGDETMVSSYMVWTRLLGRLGVILSLGGHHRQDEATAAFETAYRYERATGELARATGIEIASGFLGVTSSAYFRHQCLIVRSGSDAKSIQARFREANLGNGNLRPDESRRQRAGFDSALEHVAQTSAQGVDLASGPAYAIQRAVDNTYHQLLKNSASLDDSEPPASDPDWLSGWLTTALEEIEAFSELHELLKGERVDGFEMARSYVFQMLIVAYGILAIARRLSRLEDSKDIELLVTDSYKPLDEEGERAKGNLDRLLGEVGSAASMRHPLIDTTRLLCDSVQQTVRCEIDAKYRGESKEWKQWGGGKRSVRVRELQEKLTEAESAMQRDGFFQHEQLLTRSQELVTELVDKFGGVKNKTRKRKAGAK
ncbi:MAG: hypothetical protein QNJ14_09450 [Woeseiaceae bacterium]|nr:hypothetical protein [Woeseiaceae bacterium]